MEHVYNKPLTVNGAVAAQAAHTKVLLFDGSDDYVSCGAESGYNTVGVGTAAVWVKSTVAYPSVDGTSRYRGIIGKTTGATADKVVFHLDWYGTNIARTLRGMVSDGATAKSAYVAGQDLSEWTHVAMVWDAVNVRMYVNGLKAGVATATGYVIQQLPAANVEVGRGFCVANASYAWTGSVGGVRILDCAACAHMMYEMFQSEARLYGVKV
jgi:hypothetical protein